jgi:hypothetical protein
MSVRWYSINSYIECATCTAQYVLWGNRVMLFILSVRRAPLSFIFFLFVQYCISFPSSVQYDLLFILSVRRAPPSIVIFFSPSSVQYDLLTLLLLLTIIILCVSIGLQCVPRNIGRGLLCLLCVSLLIYDHISNIEYPKCFAQYRIIFSLSVRRAPLSRVMLLILSARRAPLSIVFLSSQIVQYDLVILLLILIINILFVTIVLQCVPHNIGSSFLRLLCVSLLIFFFFFLFSSPLGINLCSRYNFNDVSSVLNND